MCLQGFIGFMHVYNMTATINMIDLLITPKHVFNIPESTLHKPPKHTANCTLGIPSNIPPHVKKLNNPNENNFKDITYSPCPSLEDPQK